MSRTLPEAIFRKPNITPLLPLSIKQGIKLHSLPHEPHLREVPAQPLLSILLLFLIHISALILVKLELFNLRLCHISMSLQILVSPLELTFPSCLPSASLPVPHYTDFISPSPVRDLPNHHSQPLSRSSMIMALCTCS